jgi:hypothetical protein
MANGINRKAKDNFWFPFFTPVTMALMIRNVLSVEGKEK